MTRDYIALAAQYQADVLNGTIPACTWVRLAMERNRRDLDRQETPGFPYRFDPDKARRICQFAEMLPHIEGDYAKVIGQDEQGRNIWASIVLEPWQCWFFTTLFGWVHAATGLRRFRIAILLVPRKNGKALALDTEIPTPDGFKRMADLAVGDYVFSARGVPTRIIAESPVMIGRPCYEVQFSTGERIVADAEHLWKTTTRVDAPGRRYHPGPSPSVQTRIRTTAEIARTVTYGARGDRNHSVRVASAIELPDDPTLPINPYVLGAWLGDGTSRLGNITSADAEVIHQIELAEGEVRMLAQRTSNGLAATYRIGRSYRDGQPAHATLRYRLRMLDVLGNKHIPVTYLRASRSQRLALLQGLMDTDGTASKAGQLTFVSTSERLAADVRELVASLGFKPTLTSRDAKLYGRVVGTAYQIQFWAGATPVFRLERKLVRQRPFVTGSRSVTRQIVSVDAVSSVPVKCITVEDSDGMYLVGRSFIPTHNSTMGAIAVLYMLVADGESGARCYSAATSRDQAKVIAEFAWEMAKRSPMFCEYFGVRIGAETHYTLSVPSTASKFLPLSADANSLDGLNISFAAVDELHAHHTPAVWRVIDTATGSRRQPLILAPTTAGVDIGGICHQKLDYLKRVLDGVIVDESLFGTNYTIDDGDDLRDIVIRKKANPNYGVSVDPADLERKIAEAQVSQSELNNVLTKHFNVWIRTESSWMSASTWQTCASPAAVTLDLLKSVPCFIGVDLGETRDPSSLALLFKVSADTYAFIPRIYMPEEVVARSPIAEITGWTRQGYLIETPGNEADYARIKRDLHEFIKTLQVQEIDFDRRSARLLMQDLRAELEPTMGRDRVESFVLDIPQSVDTMDPAMKTTEALVLAQKIQHDGNPAMAWMISNIVVERDHKGQIYPRKAGGKDSHNKIDAAVALFTALSRAMQQPMAPPHFDMFFIGGSK